MTKNLPVMRERKEAAPESRKERVIHARIPASLDTEIKRLAERLRIPVSNLVRNILHDTVAMVDGVQTNVDQAMEGLRASLGRLGSRVKQATKVREETQREPAPLDYVLGWQEVLLNRDLMCASCGRALERGSRALLGITTESGARIFVCSSCAPQRQSGEREL